jgi:CubicO group peptidase (beta-lactamase class C family)
MNVLSRLIPVAVFTALAAHAQTDFDAVVQKALQEFHVPGMAVGIIKDGHVELAKGYGVRKQGDPAPVTEHSLFQIASNTKAFTSAALAILVDEKKIRWDERVIDVLPDFQMSDPYVTREMQIRDLLCHRSGLGLGAGDLMFFPDSKLSTAEFLRHLRYVPLATSFRSQYAYDNVLYVVAGQVIEKASGKSWSDFIRERIFVPLGMTESHISTAELRPQDDVAAPHARVGDTLQVVPETELGPSAPAGAIVSSVQDLLKWVNTQLNEGQYAGGRLFSAAQSREMWTPQIFIPIPTDYPKELELARPQFAAYALGWVVNDFHGVRVVSHTGGLAGMVTRVALIPSRKFGVVVLTNQEEGAAFQAVVNSAFDREFGNPQKDWVAAYAAVVDRNREEARKKVAAETAHRNTQSKPSLPLSKYAGTYRDAWYGDVSVSEAANGLQMSFSHSPRLSGKLEHFQYDTWIARWTDRTLNADAYVTFSLDPDGSIRDVKMQPVSPETDFSFDFQDLDLRPVTQPSAH